MSAFADRDTLRAASCRLAGVAGGTHARERPAQAVNRRSSVVVLLAGVVACVAASARADTTGGGGGVQVGGHVPSEIALSLGTPTAFAKTSEPGVYRLVISSRITSTADLTQLSVADGQDLSGAAHGHLRDGARIARAPLEVGIVGRPMQASLAAPFDPVLRTWEAPVAQTPATIAADQALPGGSSPSRRLGKVLVVTVSTQTP
jgi:hypothetical protein